MVSQQAALTSLKQYMISQGLDVGSSEEEQEGDSEESEEGDSDESEEQDAQGSEEDAQGSEEEALAATARRRSNVVIEEVRV